MGKGDQGELQGSTSLSCYFNYFYSIIQNQLGKLLSYLASAPSNMLFTEPTFLFLFLPLLLWLYWICPNSLRNGLLILASIVFYGLGEKEYTIIILGSILFNYAGGLALNHEFSPTRRKIGLAG